MTFSKVDTEPAGKDRSLHGMLTRRASSLVGSKTSIEKLNGQVYTPLLVAELMLEMVEWPRGRSGGILLDPSCGDGVFLEAAIRKVLRSNLSDVTKQAIIERRLIGWDIDPEAVAACEARLKKLLGGLAPKSAGLPRLECRNALIGEIDGFVSCVAGNPPYLEAKRMPSELKALVKERCPLAARGAFDLYSAFIERAHELTLRSRGELCLIVPNRFLVVSYAEKLRREILEGRDVGVVDLSSEKVFGKAAVYPIIFSASAPKPSPSYRVLSSDERGPGVRVSSSLLREHPSCVMPLSPPTRDGQRLFSRVLAAPSLKPLGELASARWTVSFHRAGLRDEYLSRSKPPGREHARPFLGGGRFAGNRELEPYRIDHGGWWIDYDETRARADGNPLPPAEIFDSPKLVVCQNARRARAAMDRGGLVLKDTFLAVLPRNRRAGLLEWLCIVLNSDLLHFIYEHLYGGTRKGGGYLHFLPRYLGALPIPDDFDARLVLKLHADLESGADVAMEAEDLVRRSYSVTRRERSALDSYPFPRY